MNQALADACLRYLDGDLTEDERKAFDQLLVQSPEAADLLSQLALDEQHYRVMPAQSEDDLLAELLRLEAAAQPIPQDIAGAEALESGAVGSRCDEPSPGALAILSDPGFWGYLARAGLRTRAGKWAAAAAAVILVGTLVVFIGGPSKTAQAPNLAGTQSEPNRPDPAPTPAPAVATLTATHNATWGGAASAAPGQTPSTGDPLHPGTRLTLTAGFAEITTARGAIAIIEAPATIELTDNDNALHLHTGKLVGICETDSSKGFVVRTPHMDITDLGTRFGVDAASSDATEVHVFDGAVKLTRPASGAVPSARRILRQGQAARAEASTAGFLDQLTDADRFARRLPAASGVATAHTNLDGFDVRVIPRGAVEDAKLHTDRSHELNGLDENGIPQVLRGGDLVITPADARTQITQGTEAFRLDLDLARPTTVYFLYSEEAVPPDWLTRDYQLTDMRVGMDFAQHPNRRNWSPLGVGPGRGIDQILAVWQRKQTAVGRVTVGENVTNTAYSLILVPLEEGGAANNAR